PLGMGGKEDPARLVFDGKAGDGGVVSVLDCGSHDRVVLSRVGAATPKELAPNRPVARVVWTPYANFQEGVTRWIESGGGHHTVVSLALTMQQIKDWARMVNLECVVIE